MMIWMLTSLKNGNITRTEGQLCESLAGRSFLGLSFPLQQQTRLPTGRLFIGLSFPLQQQTRLECWSCMLGCSRLWQNYVCDYLNYNNVIHFVIVRCIALSAVWLSRGFGQCFPSRDGYNRRGDRLPWECSAQRLSLYTAKYTLPQ